MVVDIEHQRALKREQMRRYRQRKKALQDTTEASTVRYYRPTTKLLQNERESTTRPYSRSSSTTEGNIKILTPKPVEPVYKPSKNANIPVNPAKVENKPKKLSIFDFAFGTQNYSDYKKDRLLRQREKRKNAESIFDWVSGLLGFGD